MKLYRGKSINLYPIDLHHSAVLFTTFMATVFLFLKTIFEEVTQCQIGQWKEVIMHNSAIIKKYDQHDFGF